MHKEWSFLPCLSYSLESKDSQTFLTKDHNRETVLCTTSPANQCPVCHPCGSNCPSNFHVIWPWLWKKNSEHLFAVPVKCCCVSSVSVPQTWSLPSAPHLAGFPAVSTPSSSVSYWTGFRGLAVPHQWLCKDGISSLPLFRKYC